MIIPQQWKRRVRNGLMTIALSVGVLMPAAAADTDADPATDTTALDSFVERLGGTRTLTADFVQTITDSGGNELQQVSGQLAIGTPGKLRWQTEPPFEQLVVSDGEVLWVFDSDLEQVTIRDLEMKVQETPALLLSGEADHVAANFTVERLLRNGSMTYRLTPKDQSRLFTALEFSYEDQTLTAMRILDATGQTTRIALSNVERNGKVDAMAFVFDVPEGADVIDARTGF